MIPDTLSHVRHGLTIHSICLDCGRDLEAIPAPRCWPACEPYILDPDPAPSGGMGCILKHRNRTEESNDNQGNAGN